MRKKIISLLLGMLLTVVALFFTSDKLFHSVAFLPRLNHIIYDLSLKLFQVKKKSESVVIVDIDEKSLAAEGKWPWPRSKLADLAKSLQDAGSAVIAFDILFPENDINAARTVLEYAEKQKTSKALTQYLSELLPALNNDTIFANALSQVEAVLGVFFHNDVYQSVGVLGKPAIVFSSPSKLSVPNMKHYIGNIEPLVVAARNTGFVTTIADEDGVLRRSPMFIEYNNALYPSLALEAAKLYFLIKEINIDLHKLDDSSSVLGVRLGSIYIPTDPNGNILIPYIGPAFSFPYISATDVLHKNFPPETFNGKLVIIGSSAIGIGDMHATPFQSAAYPGCEIHANIAEAILSKSFLSSPLLVTGIERLAIAVIGIGVALLALHVSVIGLVIITIISEVLLFGLQTYLWLNLHWVLPHLVLPYLLVLVSGFVNIGYGYLFETRSRRKIHEIFGRYVSKDYINQMLKHTDQYNLMGKSKEMSVLFADIRNFTAISEKLDAISVSNFLNQLFTPLTEVIFKNKGTIDKYVGDMVVAFWNDPLEVLDHPQRAVEAALQMIKRVKELAPVFAKQGLDDVRIGVGINSGIMHVGDMGSQYRRNYTVLGDQVNLASRLENANKVYGTAILVSEATKEKCQQIVFRLIDRVCVKGKQIPIRIYEPICFSNEATPALLEELQQSDFAISAYYSRNWQEAKKLFTQLNIKYPNTKIYSIYLSRIQKFEYEPPASDADCSYTILS